MPLIFLAARLAILPELGVTGVSDFWQVANDKIWTGVPIAGATKYAFWQVLMFSWLANSTAHIGHADKSIYRYAKKASYGFASAFGMFIGHFMAWIASGILVAYAIHIGSKDPTAGEIAFLGAGIAGLICVVVAGWTTANPTIYRDGLAVQALFPFMKRWKITIVVGIAAIILLVSQF